MADYVTNIKISSLYEKTSASAGDLLPIVDVTDTSASDSGTTKSITYSNLYGSIQLSLNLAQVAYTGSYSDLGGKPIAGIDYLAPDGDGSTLKGVIAASVAHFGLSSYRGTIGDSISGNFPIIVYSARFVGGTFEGDGLLLQNVTAVTTQSVLSNALISYEGVIGQPGSENPITYYGSFVGDGSGLYNLPGDNSQPIYILSDIGSPNNQSIYPRESLGGNDASLSPSSFIGNGINNRIVGYGKNSIVGGSDNLILNGGHSTILGGDNNNLRGAYNVILGGYSNTIRTDSYVGRSGIFGGSNNNIIGLENTFIIGSNITATQSGFTYVNNLSTAGSIYAGGDVIANTIVGSSSEFFGDITAHGIVSASSIIYASGGNSDEWNSVYSTVQTFSSKWESIYETAFNSNSAEWEASYSALTSTSATWDASYNVLTSTSANWDASYSALTSTSANWDASYNALTSTSGNWNSVYSTVNSASAEWSAGDSKYLQLTGGTINGNLTINGRLTALSSATFVDTIFTTTTALCVVNTGYGPAIYVQQQGAFDIASFYDADALIEVLHVGNNGYVGINTSYPNVSGLTVNGEISASSVIYAFKGNSNNWNASYNALTSNSANWDSSYDTLVFSSPTWDSAYNALNSTSGNWDASYSALIATSSTWNNSYNALTSTSGNWNSVYSTVSAASADWNNGSGNYLPLSGGTVDGSLYASDLTVTNNISAGSNISTTGSFISGGVDLLNIFTGGGGSGDLSSLVGISGNWQNAYTVVDANSASWDTARNYVNSYSSNWDSAYQEVNDKGGNWDQAYNSIGTINSVYGTVSSASGSWNNSYNALASTSSNWNVSYNTLTSTSGEWVNSYNVVSSNSANWNEWSNSYNILLANSANWDESYLIATSISSQWSDLYNTFTSNSSNWESAYNEISSNSFDWNITTNLVSASADTWSEAYNIVYANSADWSAGNAYNNILLDEIASVVSSSSADWNATKDIVNIGSDNWDGVYNTVNSSSANWELSYSLLSSSSSNWDTAYTLISANSANTDTVYSIVCANSAYWTDMSNMTYGNADLWTEAYILAHEQNSDVGTSSTQFQLDSAYGVILKTSSDNLQIRNATDTDYSNLTAKNIHSTGSITGSDPTNWNSAYNLVNSGGTINGDLTIHGRLTALSGATFVNTIFTTTSSLCIVNLGGQGPALYVQQAEGTGDVASFYNEDGRLEVLHIGNGGYVGINTSYPAFSGLTVNGQISGSSTIYSSDGNSNNWNSVYSKVNASSANWDSSYTTISSNSASWAGGGSSTTILSSNSANWNTAYTLVSANIGVQSLSASGTCNGAAVVLVSAVSGNVALTLPPLLNGRIINIKKIDSTANTVTITPPSGTIDGTSNRVLTIQYQSITIVCDGINHFII